MENLELKTITNLCKRRGIIFQSSEIYGGINGFWDYGPYGIALKRALERLWWSYMVEARDNVIGQDSTIICHPRVWDASGHTSQFADIMVDNKDNKKRYRLDQLISSQSKETLQKLAEKYSIEVDIDKLELIMSEDLQKTHQTISDLNFIDPHSKKKGDWTQPKNFNLMMQTYVGPVFDEDHKAYLRAETCQPIFSNFSHLQTTLRQKLPFGIAQIGKAFRNEINPRNFIFRSREFTQMEMEFFCEKEESMGWYEYWKKQRLNFYFDILGFKNDVIKIHAHEKLAHYAKAALDIEFKFPFGWGELEGIHHRGTWDMSRHEEFSKQKLKYFNEQKKEFITPTVVETSVGLDRLVLACLCHFYDEDSAATQKKGKDTDVRVVLRFPASIAPVQVAILPLSKKLEEPARELYNEFLPIFRTEFDMSGNIGKRYRRQDEIGTPFCVTIDFDSLEDQQCTVRERDSMEQTRIPLKELQNFLLQRI